jgi:putative sterol carrier protein
MNENPEPHKDSHVTYQFNVTGENENVSYQLQLNHGKATVNKSETAEPDCTLTLSAENFKRLLLGKLNGTAAFMTGKLKVKGSLGYALKLQNILGQYEVDSYL